MKTIQETAKEIIQVIEKKVRDNGTSFMTIDYDKLKFGERLRSAVRNAHGASLPNDYIYGAICDFIYYTLEHTDTDQLVEDFIDHYRDYAKHALLEWSVEHYSWVDDCIEGYGLPTSRFSFIELITQGQRHQLHHIALTILCFLETETSEIIKEKVEAILDDREEYVTTHRDSGDNYGFLLSEAPLSHTAQKLLLEIKNNFDHSIYSIDRSFIEQIDREWIEEYLYDELSSPEMRHHGSIFLPSYNDALILDGFDIGEIEEQIDFDELIERIKHDEGIEVTRDDIVQALELDKREQDRNCFYAHRSLDAWWYAVIRTDAIAEKIKSFIDDQEEKLEQALSDFQENILPELDQDDEIAIREAYNNYLDELNRDGALHNITVFNAENPF